MLGCFGAQSCFEPPIPGSPGFFCSFEAFLGKRSSGALCRRGSGSESCIFRLERRVRRASLVFETRLTRHALLIPLLKRITGCGDSAERTFSPPRENGLSLHRYNRGGST
jgi:hypothetical protein